MRRGATSGLAATASVDISVIAKGSQQLVVVLGLLSGLSIAAFFYFVWHLHPLLWLPGASAIALVAATIWVHGRSRRFLDLAIAKDTRVLSDGSKTSVTTNAVTLADPDASDALQALVSNMANRKHLPEADGIVDSRMLPDSSPAALAVARQRVESANAESDELARRALAEVGGRGPLVAQPLVVAPPIP